MNQQNTIVEELKLIAPSVATINKKMPQQLPIGYFETFAEKILLLAKHQSDGLNDGNELNDIAPLLNQISRKPIQSLPQGYFESFNVDLPKQQSTVVKMHFIRKWMSYSSAAIVAGILVTAGFLYTNKNNQSFDFDQYNKINISTALNNISEEELVNYLNGASSLNVNHGWLDPELINEIEGNFRNIGDDEMLQYLNENGEKPIKKTS
jgi:hypothetical protein